MHTRYIHTFIHACMHTRIHTSRDLVRKIMFRAYKCAFSEEFAIHNTSNTEYGQWSPTLYVCICSCLCMCIYFPYTTPAIPSTVSGVQPCMYAYVVVYVCAYVFHTQHQPCQLRLEKSSPAHVCARVSMCMYGYMCMHVTICMEVSYFVCVYSCMHAYMYIFKYVCMYVCIYIYAYMHICIYAYMYVCISK